jgi:hypothetical protein
MDKGMVVVATGAGGGFSLQMLQVGFWNPKRVPCMVSGLVFRILKASCIVSGAFTETEPKSVKMSTGFQNAIIRVGID